MTWTMTDVNYEKDNKGVIEEAYIFSVNTHQANNCSCVSTLTFSRSAKH